MADKHFSHSVHRRLARLVHLFVRVWTDEKSAGRDVLCEELGVSRRTLYRDMNMLRRAGVQIEHNVEKNHLYIKDFKLGQPIEGDWDGDGDASED